jgi:hypothetical protein
MTNNKQEKSKETEASIEKLLDKYPNQKSGDVMKLSSFLTGPLGSFIFRSLIKNYAFDRKTIQ